MNRTSKTSEVIDQSEFHDDRFVSDEFILPSLQKMAAYRVALAMWYNLIALKKRNASKNETISRFCHLIRAEPKSDYSIENYHKNFDELVTTSFSTKPKFIREILTECLRGIHKNVSSWIHWCLGCFQGNFYRYQMHDVDPNCCVWYPNGEIDYRRSTVNILSNPGLNAEQKFTLMSVYCMEDEIKTFSLHSLNPDFMELVNFNDCCMVHYWICYLKNTLHEIPTDDFSSIDVTMAAKIMKLDIVNRTHWTAFQYFWNRLGIEDKILIAKLCFNSAIESFKMSGYLSRKNFNFYDVEERLFSMMSWYQQRRFIYPTLDESILIFCIRLDSPEITFWTWNRCKDLLTIEQFANMVDSILRKSVEYENVMKVFMHMWNTVPTHFRTYTLKMKENEIIRYFSHRTTLSPSSIKFLFEFLSLKSSNFRKKFVLNNAAEICNSIEDPRCITELLNFCLPNQTDQMELKKLVLNSDYFKENCYHLFIYGDENLFKIKSTYYALNMHDVINLKKWILESDDLKNDRPTFLFDVDNWNKLSNLIDEIYPDDPSLALEAKKQVVLSFAANPLRNYLIESGDNLEKIIAITEILRFTDDEKETLKQICLNCFEDVLYRRPAVYTCYSYEGIQKLLSWCLGDEKGAILNFKNTISVDVIFNKFLNDLLEIYIEYSNLFEATLSQFDEYLRWHFTSVQEMKRFKMDKINNCDIKILKILSEQNNEVFLELLLKWFFVNDETAILEFKFRGSCKNQSSTSLKL